MNNISLLMKGHNTTYYFEYKRCTFSFTITHSPITLANFSSINLVFIFRCSSSPINPMYARREDSSGLYHGHPESCTFSTQPAFGVPLTPN